MKSKINTVSESEQVQWQSCDFEYLFQPEFKKKWGHYNHTYKWTGQKFNNIKRYMYTVKNQLYSEAYLP